MAYKNVQHYRHTVHRYLDAIWSVSTHQKKARSTMYKLLSNRMNLSAEETHVSKFNRDQCKEAIRILRPMYIQLFGKDLDYKRKEKTMYYSSTTFSTVVTVKFENKTKTTEKHFYLKITVYCRNKTLNDKGVVIDNDLMEQGLRKFLDNKCLNDVLKCEPTLERLANYIYEQVIPCYKVKIESPKGDIVIYEEDED